MPTTHIKLVPEKIGANTALASSDAPAQYRHQHRVQPSTSPTYNVLHQAQNVKYSIITD